jgi:hypothetical protein
VDEGGDYILASRPVLQQVQARHRPAMGVVEARPALNVPAVDPQMEAGFSEQVQAYLGW